MRPAAPAPTACAGPDVPRPVSQLLALVKQLHASLEKTSVPDVVRALLTREVVVLISEQLVEGCARLWRRVPLRPKHRRHALPCRYSHTKKCSDEGRQMMSLDVKTLQGGLKRLLPSAELPMESLAWLELDVAAASVRQPACPRAAAMSTTTSARFTCPPSRSFSGPVPTLNIRPRCSKEFST